MNKIIVGVYVFVSLAVIIILAISLSKKKCNENFRQCVCSQSMDKRICQNTDLVKDLYETGKLTENSNLRGSSLPGGWTKFSPGDYEYPVSEGCRWPNVENSKQWAAWDFTDFGG